MEMQDQETSRGLGPAEGVKSPRYPNGCIGEPTYPLPSRFLGHAVGHKGYKINSLRRNIHPKKMRTDAYNSCVRNAFRMQHGENRRPALAPAVRNPG